MHAFCHVSATILIEIKKIHLKNGSDFPTVVWKFSSSVTNFLIFLKGYHDIFQVLNSSAAVATYIRPSKFKACTSIIENLKDDLFVNISLS